MRGPLIIGLIGRAGAGKDTAADYLCAAHGFERYAFAQPLKTMLESLFVEVGINYARLFEPSLKEQLIEHLCGASLRQLMQRLGTEWGRQIHPDFWLRCADLCLGLHSAPDAAPVHDRIVITDVRFPNEREWVTSKAGLAVRIQRDSAAPVAAHVSEQHADTLRADHELDNNHSIAALHFELDCLMENLERQP